MLQSQPKRTASKEALRKFVSENVDDFLETRFRAAYRIVRLCFSRCCLLHSLVAVCGTQAVMYGWFNFVMNGNGLKLIRKPKVGLLGV